MYKCFDFQYLFYIKYLEIELLQHIIKVVNVHCHHQSLYIWDSYTLLPLFFLLISQVKGIITMWPNLITCIGVFFLKFFPNNFYFITNSVL